MKIYDELVARGLIAQVTDEKGKVWTLEESEIAKANLAVVF